MTNWTPETKIGSTAIATALGTLVTAIASHRGVHISPEAAAAIVGFAGVAIGYLVPNQWRRLEPVEDVDPKLFTTYSNALMTTAQNLEPMSPKEFATLAKAAETLMFDAKEHAGYDLEEIS